MEPSIPSVIPIILFSIVLLLTFVITSGASIFASRIHPAIGMVIELFSRGLLGLLWIAFVVSAFSGIKEINEVYDLRLTPLMLLANELRQGAMFVAMGVFFAVIINAGIFGLVLFFSKNGASIWSGLVSTFLLLCCLLPIFLLLGQIRLLNQMLFQVN